MKQHTKRLFALLLSACLFLAGCTPKERDVTDAVTDPEYKAEENTEMKQQNTKIVSALGLTVPETLYLVIDDGNCPDGMFAARVLQGVINRKETRVYLASSSFFVEGTDIEAVKQDILREYGKVKLRDLPVDMGADSQYRAFWSLFRAYEDEIKEIYIYSTEEHLSDTANIAAMLAARNQGVAVTESLYSQMQQNGVDLPVTYITELCGFGDADNSITVNGWIADHMAEGASEKAVFCLKPTGRGGPGDLPWCYDLAVAMNALIYHVDPTNPQSLDVQKKILSQFPDNIPVMGWPGLNMENSYVENIAKLGKYVVCIDWGYTNGSVWGAFPSFRADAPVSPVSETFAVKPGKVYVAFMLSDGDAWHYCSKELLSSWNDARRGNYPLAWTIPSLFADYNPLTLRYLYDTATESDAFLQGPSGVGYMYPCMYPQKAYVEYLTQTKAALAQAGLTMVNYWDLSDNNAMIGRDPTLQNQYAEAVGVDALLLGHTSQTGKWRQKDNCIILEELGGPDGTGALTAEHIVDALLTQSRGMKDDEVRFFVVNVEVWGYRLDAVEKAVELLSDDAYEGKFQFIGLPDLIAAMRNH
ncbi:MAG: hypothetical protein IJA85_11915 [Clostridia bacterium]|nr:hypothetical protein [Clostridia bacterium]